MELAEPITASILLAIGVYLLYYYSTRGRGLTVIGTVALTA